MKKMLPLLLIVLTAGMAPIAHSQDAKEGEKKAAMCIGCHGIPGYQASFPEIHKVPMISGQNEKYIVAALAAYKKGDRKHPTMRGIAAALSDQDMADLGAFYAGQGGTASGTLPPPNPEVAKLLERGACVSCHGADFIKTVDPSYPKLAGQHGDYLFVALKSYRAEGQTVVGRNNAIMAGMVKQFSNPELKALADYIKNLPSELRTVPQSRFR
jgi:cytochrome c553